MEAAWFLERELPRLRCDAALILLMPVSDYFCTQQDRSGVYMIIVEKKR